MSKRINRELFEKLLLIFIMIQPILDILTYFSMQTLNTSITIGIIVRVLFMIVSLWFIFFGNHSRLKKYVITYLVALAAVLSIGLVYNFFTKPIFDPFLELQFLAKTVYFPIMLGAYLLLFTTLDKTLVVRMRIMKAITIAMLIIAVTMFMAILTGTSSETYEWNKFGFKGWFNSGNEIGSIIAIAFPLVYIYTLQKVDQLKKLYYFIPMVLIALVSILLGTKVGFFAVLGAAIIVFVSYVIYWLISKLKKTTQKEEHVPLKLLTSFIFLVLFLIATPFSPTFSNVSGDVGQINEQRDSAQEESGDGSSEVPEDEEGEGNTKGGDDAAAELGEQALIESPILKIILSSRNIYFAHIYDMYEEADVIQKTFGMGYAGNYEDIRKLIEMDFFDLFFYFGILGIILISLPFLLIAGLFLKLLFQAPGDILHPQNILILLSIGFGAGIAFLAGHVLYAPAVSIYLAISIVLLLANMLNLNKRLRNN
ncbi:O-antigen ligase family protein [Halobacillus karajensis]|uniref:Lipid A core-O-antigen ligase n=1 Tax=Halobacillus karajensis TaxID=195088 RepID=A0A059NVB1_9BACI|nr:O-antigen ligase family protein [Halobacillus karajensis]CDQ18917.1 Lipid A core-O-antigen ligase [Halobacillus karajensis]CDQ23010.1 Lipid A core-O-antigen ligase [Halobacillus karajensis]CDQ26492.1 Lipid A core-O-antigen ligase [Halobacillus karajensis]